jgi:NADPH:quinone reductase-like Zn-dependent oxidoreductase
MIAPDEGLTEITGMHSKQTRKETMRGITLESFDTSPELHEVPTPQIATNEVLIRVHAASINAVDVATAAGMLRGINPEAKTDQLKC